MPENILAGPLTWIKKRLIIVEILLLSVSGGFWVLQNSRYPGFETPSICCLILLAAIYFLMAFRPIEKKTNAEEIFLKIMGISLAVSVTAILFITQRWPNADIELLMGISTLAVSFTVCMTGKIFRANKVTDTSDYFRMILFFVFMLLLYISPLNTKYPHSREKEEIEMEMHQKQGKQVIP